MKRKVKPNLSKLRAGEVLHLNYLRVYHEVLKHEDILDIELDDIYAAVVFVLQRRLSKCKLQEVPDPVDIEVLVKETMDRLVVK